MVIKSSQVEEKNKDGTYKYHKVIQILAGIKWIFERDDRYWIQKDKATEEDEETFPVVIDD